MIVTLRRSALHTKQRLCRVTCCMDYIQVLEDMLRACVLDHRGSWEEHFPLVEFAYNNSYQASIQVAPYEALYGRPCRSPLCWTEVGESSITGPDLIRDTSEKVSLIRQRLLTAQSRQKSYADVRRRPIEFEVGDHAFLKVMPKRGEGKHCSVPVGFTAQHVKCP